MRDAMTGFRHILRASLVVGAGSAANVLFGVVRVKVLALILGPAGVGMVGLLTNIMSVTSAIATLGIGSSGVRQVAAASRSGNPGALWNARRALFVTAAGLGVVGGLCLLGLSSPVSLWMFGTKDAASSIAWLTVGVLLSSVSAANAALLNGLNRVDELAKATALGGLFSAALGIAAILGWGEAALVPFILAGPLGSWIATTRYARRAAPARISSDLPPLMPEIRALLVLGSAVMAADLLSNAAQLQVRVQITRDLGIEGAGLFQASWTISMAYIAFVLTAMSTDFYARLSGAIVDRAHIKRLVNDQTRVGLLLAGPVVLLVAAFAPTVVTLLFSSSFAPAADMLRWQLIGDALRIVAWPLGLIPLAAGRPAIFFVAQATWSIGFVIIATICVAHWGLEGAGVAFLLVNVLYTGLVYVNAIRLTSFAWSRTNVVGAFALLVLTAAVVAAREWWSAVGPIVAVFVVTAYSIYAFCSLTKLAGGATDVCRVLRRLRHMGRRDSGV